MTTLLRLLKFVRCLSTLSKPAITNIKFESSSINVLVHPQTVLLTNGFKNSRSSYNMQSNEKYVDQEIGINQKITMITKEIQFYGRISEFLFDSLLSDIKKHENITSLQGLFLLQCCIELIVNKPLNSRQKLGDDVWNLLKKLNVPLDVSHYNALLSIYLGSEYDFSPLNFLDEMVNSNVQPNKVTFQRLISQFCNQGKVVEASQILEYMEIEQIPENEDVLCSFINGHLINNNIDAAFETLKKMERLNIIPSIQTYSAFMNFYAKKGDIENIRKILAECEAKDIWVPHKVLLSIIYHLGLNGFTEYIDEILSVMSKGRIYAKEANKIIYKLVEKKQENIAFMIFQSLTKSFIKDQNTKTGNLFIQTLINLNVPTEKSIEYCRIMNEEGINRRAFISAIKESIAHDMYESSLALMTGWNELGGRIEEHYFYPILEAYGKAAEDLKNVLSKMVTEFKIEPSIYMLKTYILPYMQNNMDEALFSLLNCQVNLMNASNAILLYLFSENKLYKAMKFMSMNMLPYKVETLKHSLLQAFKNTEDVPSFARILHYLYKVALYETDNTVDIQSVDKKYIAQRFIDSCVLEIIHFLPANNKYLIFILLKNLVDKGFTISVETAKEVEEKLGNQITPEALNDLNALKSGDLVPKSIFLDFRINNNRWATKLTSVEELEKTIELFTETNNNAANYLKKKLLYFYCYNFDEKKVLALFEEFEKTGTSVPLIAVLILIDTYIDSHKIEKAEFWIHKKMKKIYPKCQLNQKMCLKLALALVETGDLERAQEYIISPTYPSDFNLTDICNKLLSSVAKYNDEELLQRFLDLLTKHNFIKEMRPTLFSPFIQLYLSRGDKEAALQKFEWAYNTYNFAPHSILIMKQFMCDGDEISLKRVIEMCSKCHSKTIASFNLAIAYIECNDLGKAKDIIENYCMNIYEENVRYYAEKCYKSDKVEILERLYEVLNSLKFDVGELCTLLLKSYGARNEWEKGYNLWIRMQEDKIKPSDSFINYLIIMLKKKHSEENNAVKDLNNTLKHMPYIETKKLLHSLPTVYKSDCYSELCRTYVKRNQSVLAVDIWQDLYEQFNLNLDFNTAELVLSKLLKEKDVESIETIGEFLNLEFKKKLKYNFYLNQVYLQAGVWNLYLKKLESKLNNGLQSWHDLNLHFNTIIHSLIIYPELREQFESLAYKFAEKNLVIPIQAVWVYYFLQKNPKADEIWTKHMKTSSLQFWLKAINLSQTKNDPELYLKLAEIVQQSVLASKIKLIAYSRLIKSCINLDNPKNYEFGLKCLQYAMSDCLMKEFNVDLLADLQTGLEKSGIPWPWSINLYERIDDVSKPSVTDTIR